MLSLGPCEVSVGEMTSAYTTFANGGIRCSPLFVTKIEDSHGNVIAKFQPLMTEVISEISSYQMIDMLRAVIEGGTASRLRYAYLLRVISAERRVQLTTIPMVGSWVLRLNWSVVAGSEVRIVTSISTTPAWDKVLLQPCQYGLTTCKRSLLTLD